MAHGSLQNNKEALDTYPVSAYAPYPVNRHWRHTVYLTAKPRATQIRASGGSFGAICRRLPEVSELR